MKRLSLFSIVLVGLVSLSGSRPLSALDQTTIDKLLRQEIIGPLSAMAEVQDFTEQRVPLMPQVKTKDQWEKHANRIRRDVLQQIVYRGQAAQWRDAPNVVQWLETIDGGPGYRIRKLRYQAAPGMWIPALLYEPTHLKAKAPVALNVNGHDRKDGKAAQYKQMRCINQAKRGIIALNVEWIGMGQLNQDDNSHYRLNQINLCGSSGLAPFYLAMKRGLDILLEHPHADPSRVAVAGLSGGGWQTIFFSSLDTRVTLANPVAGYSSFRTRARHLKDLGDSEQTPNDLATVADYTHLTALLAPRAALLTFNSKDNCCFEAPYALPPLENAARPIYQLYGQTDRLRTHINEDPGTHNFEQDNREALYRMFRDFFFSNSDKFDAAEIDSSAELKTKQQLDVPLAENNASLHSLALDLCQSLPHSSPLPHTEQAARAWQRDTRQQLRKIVHWRDYQCVGQEHAASSQDGVQVTHWRLKVGSEWTVPAVEFSPADATSTVIVVDDGGRAATSETVARLLDEKKRVLAVDPFYFGESKIQQRDFLFALMVATVGERPLGIQSSQLAAIASWSRRRNHNQPVTILANGPRSSTFSLVAAAAQPDAISAVELSGSWGSLREVIEQNKEVKEMPEMFCFGLLERFDILQIAALVAPRKVTLRQPSERARAELSELVNWYKVLNARHNPLE